MKGAESGFSVPEKKPAGFQYDLNLSRFSQRRLAVWIERRDGSERLCLADYGAGGVGAIQCVGPAPGALRRPKTDGERIIWTQFQDGRGRLYARWLDEKDEPRPIAAAADLDCGDFALLRNSDGSVWLLVEEIAGRPRLLRDSGGGWELMASPDGPDAFGVHPALGATDLGVVALWGVYAEDRYRVHSGVVAADHWQDLGFLPAPPDTWETLPTVAVSGGGAVFAARCRERLVELDGGAANYHSELVVATFGNKGWRDVASVNIDHALNPWMAAYWGFRRQARLAAASDGVWLLWEEKLDIQTMSPSLGRLCALKVTVDGPQGKPSVVLSDASHIVVESRAIISPLLMTAAKTQPAGFRYRLPYTFREVDLDGAAVSRSGVRESNADRPSFTVKPAPTELPRWEAVGGLSLFFGDPHVHSNLSYDLDPEPEELYHFARDVAKLDFVALTENDATRFTEPLTPGDFEYSRRLADLFNFPGRFTTFAGWEYTMYANPDKPWSYNSHRSVIYPGRPGRIVSWFDDEAKTPPDMVKAMRGERVLLHHHHPAGYDITDNELERNIEICSGWANCMCHSEFVGRLHDLLNRGFRLGFIGASDNHERNPGLGGALTGVWAEENTREAIFEALRARRCFATTGMRPDLRFTAGDIPMGGEGSRAGAPTLTLRVRCDTPIRKVELIRNGERVYERGFDSREVDLTWADELCPAGNVWYYAHVRCELPAPAGRELDWNKSNPLPWNVKPAYGIDAWASPVFLNVKPGG